jgi:hypothetical protein
MLGHLALSGDGNHSIPGRRPDDSLDHAAGVMRSPRRHARGHDDRTSPDGISAT